MSMRSTERLTDIRDRLTLAGWLVAFALTLALAMIWRALALAAS
jgi:hypothetical protein